VTTSKATKSSTVSNTDVTIRVGTSASAATAKLKGKPNEHDAYIKFELKANEDTIHIDTLGLYGDDKGFDIDELYNAIKLIKDIKYGKVS